MQSTGWVVVAVSLAAAVATSASAELVAWQYTAELQFFTPLGSQDPIVTPDEFQTLGIGLGSAVEGTFIFDSSTKNTSRDPDFASFTDAIVGGDLSIGGLHVEYDLETINSVSVMNGTADIVSTSVGLQDAGGIDFSFLFLGLWDSTATALDSAEFLSEPPPLADFNPFDPEGIGLGTSSLLAFGADLDGKSFVGLAELTSLVGVPVPGPAGLGLFAVASLLGRRRA